MKNIIEIITPVTHEDFIIGVCLLMLPLYLIWYELSAIKKRIK